jgi:hypothetical protein
MTIDDIKVGQTWVWDDDSFTIVEITDLGRIVWRVDSNGTVVSPSTYTVHTLINAYNKDHCRLLGVTHKIKYNMDPFKFI